MEVSSKEEEQTQRKGMEKDVDKMIMEISLDSQLLGNSFQYSNGSDEDSWSSSLLWTEEDDAP